ncbi:sulfatase-like hydrolase/transferase [Brachybacterium sp. NBEC-018]|uniref:sulfatase-like hydrolase/transferase n=1 Tax=Brachybacterium sp. NBEC-018 TaxID=2996004 RepID=UPI00217506A7|nr:sulfatase-like hydrolase/transferase [Brachybacterium sp. NBEC-018]UVY84105.1 sulfatase-like hydrolase/transferase [Brachybacterium sp. NBEC-018]
MRPNVLLISTDQQRFDMVGAAGNPAVSTPHLDRLAAQGALFENCYVQNPVCSPSRASLMTSSYVSAHGLYENGVDIAPGTRLVSAELAEAGYDCGLVGKLHLHSCFHGRTEPRVVDGFRVFRWAHDPYPGSSENAYHRWLRAAHPDLYAHALEDNDRFDALPTEAHYSHWIAEETISFLRTDRRSDEPFLFVANFFDPHHGFGAPEEYLRRYDDVELPPVNTRDGELESKPEIQRWTSLHGGGGMPSFADLDEAGLDEVRRAYYAMVTLVDDEVGRILAALEEEGLAECTIVVFTSDHGELLGDHQMLRKGPFLYDCSVKVPLIVRWPGVVPAGLRRSELVQWVDLAPTFLEAAGVERPRSYQGESLVPLLRGEEGAWRDWALSQYRSSGDPANPSAHLTMLRRGSWKLIAHHAAEGRERTGELYDLEADPGELVNLWASAAHREVRLELAETMLDVLAAVEDRRGVQLAPW